jgi:hypothetical protein
MDTTEAIYVNIPDEKGNTEPLCKWCCIYTWIGVVVFGGIIALVYFFWH